MRTSKILGLDFFNDSYEILFAHLKKGGLVMAPAGPALAQVTQDSEYLRALKSADILIPDSGILALLWNIFETPKIGRLSGYTLIKNILKEPGFFNMNSSLWVMPSLHSWELTRPILKSRYGLIMHTSNAYIAPWYDPSCVRDPQLLVEIQHNKPRIIIINLGGGIQEKLGMYLKNNLDYQPIILCTGAAIAFISGEQAKIPKLADTLYLGWLWRCFQNPLKFIPRYIHGLKIIPLFLKYRHSSPAIAD